MPFLKIEGPETVSLYFEDYGQGKPVVLIHGWPLSHRMWEYQVRTLVEAGYRVISYDRRGFGDSDKPWDGYDYDTLSADLQALMGALELQDAALVGFSMGGGEVARYFGQYGSERVSKAVFVSAVTPYMLKTADNPTGVDGSVFDDFKQNVETDRIGFLEGFNKMFVNHDKGVAPDGTPISEPALGYTLSIASYASPKGTLDCITAFGETDFRPDMAKIDVPTMFVHGDADQIVPLEVSAQEAHKLVSGSRLEVFQGAPHGLVLTHTEKFNELLLEFLRS